METDSVMSGHSDYGVVQQQQQQQQQTNNRNHLGSQTPRARGLNLSGMKYSNNYANTNLVPNGGHAMSNPHLSFMGGAALPSFPSTPPLMSPTSMFSNYSLHRNVANQIDYPGQSDLRMQR